MRPSASDGLFNREFNYMKKYAIIGSWDWDGTDTVKGVNTAAVNEKTGNLSRFRNYVPDVKSGCTAAVRDNIIYFTDEQKTLKGNANGGGGYLYAAEVSSQGEIEIISQRPSLAVNPSYCTVDSTGRYLIAVHHGSSRNCATKIRKENGRIISEVVHDDAAAVLFELHADGTIGEAADAVFHEKEGRQSHLHSIYNVPDSGLLLICDKGLDCIYTYAVRRGKLVLKDTLSLPEGSDPRYGAFHPVLPLFYANNEQRSVLYTVRFNKRTGKLKLIGETQLMDQPLIAMASDTVITADGKYLYTALRMADVISVCSADEKGMPHLIGTIDAGGKNARGINLSRDGRFLYVCNTESDVIAVFRIQPDGTLKKSREIPCSRPANIRFL